MIDEYRSTGSSHEPSALFDLIGELIKFIKVADDVRRSKTRTFESSSQPITVMDEVFDLLTGKFSSAGKLGQHLFSVGASFSDHFSTLLLCKFYLCLGIGDCVGTLTRDFNFCIISNTSGVSTRLTDDSVCRLRSTKSHLVCSLASCRQNPCGLLAQDTHDGLFIENSGRRNPLCLKGSQLRFEKALPFL